ncbi:MAG: hypothetical protein COA78_06710 [Blastopirellula sp.]|nr:MAG: hypothetical protein COA78_06710 [Blastopirellula sp.]
MNILELNIDLDNSLSVSQTNKFWDEFILDAIEKNNLQYGGLNHGFVEPSGDFIIGESHSELIQSWLKSRDEVISFSVRIIEDAT